MKTITRDCDFCQQPYEAQQRYLNRNQGKFCSTVCAGHAMGLRRRVRHDPNTTCAWCSMEFYRAPSKKASSSSGLYFCCREHKDLAQRLGGIKEIQPAHYGSDTGYRDKALRELPATCISCGYDKYVEVLQVHHKDHDRSNNDISNLEWLCPTCHMEHHFETRSGPYSGMK